MKCISTTYKGHWNTFYLRTQILTYFPRNNSKIKGGEFSMVVSVLRHTHMAGSGKIWGHYYFRYSTSDHIIV